MAVLVEFVVAGASPEQLEAVELLTYARGEAVGGPPYTGCMFLAMMPRDDGFRCAAAWRTEAEFRGVLDTMLGPDLATQGLAATGIEITPIISMAIPGAHAS